LDAQGLLEVTTNCVVPVGAFEGSIDVLKVSYAAGEAELHTSPEIEMKQVLAQEKKSIYQICRCFRDDPPTGVHLREFTMLEFYRVGCDYRTIMADVKTLMNNLAGRALPFAELGMDECFQRATGIAHVSTISAEELRRQILEKDLVALSPDDGWDDMFFKVLIERVEPSLDPTCPTIIRDYPAALCALAKPHADKRTVQRFEIYWHGMELCNGCTELEDTAELKRRFQREQENRRAQGKSPHPFPERLNQAMSNGFPPCAGVAVGLERLYWALHE
jgi:lysyl-tRNA synthetase class 2